MRDKFLPVLSRMNYWMCEYARQKGFKCVDNFAEYMGGDYDSNGDGQIDSQALKYIAGETELAFARTGRDVGTPIITFHPGASTEASFFGPVISSIPRGDAALRLWDAIEVIATTSGMAELKRSIRESPNFD